MAPKAPNTRALAAQICNAVLFGGVSLDKALSQHFDKLSLNPIDKAFCQKLVYGVCRYYGELHAISQQLMHKPLRNKERQVLLLILIGVYQLKKLHTSEHAAIAETVNAATALKKQWAKNLINACLRKYQRDPAQYTASVERNYPEWLLARIKQDWPAYHDQLIPAGMEQAPMCLRINKRKTSRDNYISQLDKAGITAHTDPYSCDGIILKTPINVAQLPDFYAGAVSVQDSAAQIATHLFDLQDGLSVLDACAAPGGKTAHILESYDVDMTAIEISPARCEPLQETLSRLQLKANIIQADARNPETWETPKQGYDRILLDAPCSALGVIRRHPDILHHRSPKDIESLAQTQMQLLRALWPKLKQNGKLLYLTCSILKQENEQQIAHFIETTENAQAVALHHPNGISLDYGVQTLPGVHFMDGFYYALLHKKAQH